MPTLETLTYDDLKSVLKSESLGRARGYLDRVQNAVRQGNTLTAEVQGSRLYRVEIDVAPSGISAHCSCPYDWGGYCKHVGAVLIKWIVLPASFSSVDARAPILDGYPIEVTPVEPPPSYQPTESPWWLHETFENRRAADEELLRDRLDGIVMQDLRRMARERGWTVRGTRKADIIQQLADQITDPGQALKGYLDLDEEHHNAFRALALIGQRRNPDPQDLARLAGLWGKLTSHKNVNTYTRHLWETGLALPGNYDAYPSYGDFVPRSILRVLPPVLEDVLPATPNPPPGVSDVRQADDVALVRAANQITLLLEQSSVVLRPPMPRPRMERFHTTLQGWDYDPHELQQAKENRQLAGYSDLTLTVPPPPRRLPDEVIQRLAPVIGGEMALEFGYALLVATGVLLPGSPVTVWPEVKERFLRQSEPAQRAILTRTYFSTQNWSALWDVLRARDDVHLRRAYHFHYFKPQDLQEDLLLFRHLVLRALACLPEDKWIALADLFDVMRVLWPRFDRTVWQEDYYRSQAPAWFLASRDGAPLDAGDWDLAQGQFVAYIIAGPLHWLGLADLGLDADGLTAFRLHGLADLYWDRADAPVPRSDAAVRKTTTAPAEAVNIDARAIRVVPSQIESQAHNLLNQIARLETATAEQFAYRVDSEAVYASFETGMTLAEIEAAWETWLPVPMPVAIRDQLTAWWEAYGQVRIYKDLTVIEFGDEYALAEMKAVAPLEKHIVAEISPRMVIVYPEAVKPLTEALKQAGYTPKQTDDV
ncbi:MAG: helicase-associated domain-containing protein [Anaerolineae bacterium]|nr:helicase-associated domain-containing protein [Anaerolineae bacterium]